MNLVFNLMEVHLNLLSFIFPYPLGYLSFFVQVFNNIVDPALLSQASPAWDKPVTQETFLEEFKKVALSVVDSLKEKPIIVAHSENTFDGSGVKRLLSNKFELDKVYYILWWFWSNFLVLILLCN